MKLSEIRVEDVLGAKNWLIQGGEDVQQEISETIGFTASDVALLSAVVRFADGTEHPALVVKSFLHGGDETAIYIHTRIGWLNLQTPGFMRAAGKYSHDLFPFDYWVASPWKGGRQPEPDRTSPHPQKFREAVQRLRSQFDSAKTSGKG
jgi:hypothetical protein